MYVYIHIYVYISVIIFRRVNSQNKEYNVRDPLKETTNIFNNEASFQIIEIT